jgi:hypothetical protein
VKRAKSRTPSGLRSVCLGVLSVTVICVPYGFYLATGASRSSAREPTTVTVSPPSTQPQHSSTVQTRPQTVPPATGERKRAWWDRNSDALEVAIISGVLVALCVGLVRWIRTRRQRSLSPVTSPESAQGPGPVPFELVVVAGSGENIFQRRVDQQHDSYLFVVRIHVTLWTRDTIEIRNISLDYDWPATTPGPFEAIVNGDRYRHDSSYRFIKKVPLLARTSADIIVRREFLTAVDPSTADYRNLTLRFALTTEQGFGKLTARGRLAPGGRIDDFAIAEIEPNE